MCYTKRESTTQPVFAGNEDKGAARYGKKSEQQRCPGHQKNRRGSQKGCAGHGPGQIEKQFGKGAVMKLGDNTAMQVDAISTGSLGLDMALGVGVCPAAASLRCMARNPAVRPRWLCTFCRSPEEGRRRGVHRRGTRTGRCMPRHWAWTSTICWSASRTPVSRPWRSAKRWCAPVHRRHRGGLGGSHGAPCRDRGRDGRQPCGLQAV